LINIPGHTQQQHKGKIRNNNTTKETKEGIAMIIVSDENVV
jgi:hypothetical protein